MPPIIRYSRREMDAVIEFPSSTDPFAVMEFVRARMFPGEVAPEETVLERLLRKARKKRKK